MQLYSWGFDVASAMTGGVTGRALMVAADMVLNMPYLGIDFNQADSNWFLKEKWWPYLPAYHEFGHARASRAFSKNEFSGYTIQVNGIEHRKNSVLWYYWYSVKHLSYNEGALAHIDFATRRPDQRLAIYAGGLNNESRLAKEVTDLIYRNNGHIAYFGTYLRSKIAPISYTLKTKSGAVSPNSGDMNYIANYYNEVYPNYVFNLDYIQYGGLASFLLSSSTYSFLYGFWNFITSGDPTVRTFTCYGFRLPDINFYFTRNGLSLEVVTAYEVNPNLWINLGVETVYYPQVSMEFTPAVRYIIPTSIYGTFDLEAGLVANAYGNFSGHVGLEWTDPVNPLTIHTKLIHHNANTYVGERNTPNAKDSDHYVEFMIAASYNY